MTGVPVETVVELLMRNADYRRTDVDDMTVWPLQGPAIRGWLAPHLRAKVREYVETLARTGENECQENERQ
jgi:hypothetical protein